jgi:hypothetical protein
MAERAGCFNGPDPVRADWRGSHEEATPLTYLTVIRLIGWPTIAGVCLLDQHVLTVCLKGFLLNMNRIHHSDP